MKNITRLIAAAALALGTTAVAVTANAEDPLADHRPCVDNREYAGASYGAGRTVLENAWEVSGLGQHVMFFGNDIIAYPWCDHPNRLGDTSRAWIGVTYNDKREAESFWKWQCSWDQPWGCDGPPPPPVPQPTPTPTPTPSPTTEPCTVKCPPPMLRGSIHR
jgi:hypothetical protein